MVEYALLIAGSALAPLAAQASQFVADLNWQVVGFIALVLLALRLAFWAFKVSV
jgi:hypothetical protein